MRKVILVLTCILAGCVPHDIHGLRPLKPLGLATVQYAPFATEELTGSLMYENGCLLFRTDDTENLFLPIWPAGSVFNGTSVIFHSPGRSDQPILIAQHFSMAGRRVSWSLMSDGAFAPFHHQCGSAPFIVTGVRPAD